MGPEPIELFYHISFGLPFFVRQPHGILCVFKGYCYLLLFVELVGKIKNLSRFQLLICNHFFYRAMHANMPWVPIVAFGAMRKDIVKLFLRKAQAHYLLYLQDTFLYTHYSLVFQVANNAAGAVVLCYAHKFGHAIG